HVTRGSVGVLTQLAQSRELTRQPWNLVHPSRQGSAHVVRVLFRKLRTSVQRPAPEVDAHAVAGEVSVASGQDRRAAPAYRLQVLQHRVLEDQRLHAQSQRLLEEIADALVEDEVQFARA